MGTFTPVISRAIAITMQEMVHAFVHTIAIVECNCRSNTPREVSVNRHWLIATTRHPCCISAFILAMAFFSLKIKFERHFAHPVSHTTKTFIGEQQKFHNVLAFLRLIAV